MKRNQMIVLALIGATILVVATYPLWSPYFINDVVDEAFPGLTSVERDALRAMPEDQRSTLIEISQENREMAEETAKSMMSADVAADEAMPEEPVPLLAGSWIQIDAVHRAEGTATLYQVGEQRVLRFENFRVTNGPDLHVVLAKNVPTGILEGVGEDYVDLGKLKGNVGSQNYEIPTDVNLDEFASVVIYCVPFHVVFSSAELAAA